MEYGHYIIFAISAIVLTTILILIFLNSNKNEQISKLKVGLIKLRKSFNELDQQAKLIVKTDLELNKAQEELDRRLTSLDALQKTSRLISTTLDENEIFHRIDQSLIQELGFEKNIILIKEASGKLKARVHLGFNDEDIQYIISNFEKDNSLLSALEEGHTFSSVNSPKQRKESISRLFDVEHFIISPILTQNGIVGTISVGNYSNTAALTEGDEELVSILANQIGQSLENAKLFKEVYQSRQSLETRIQDRTKQLASALDEVNLISKTKSEFISAVSHELRTPLTSIKGYASLLMTGKLGVIPEKVKDRLAKINTHSDNLVKLINDLLDIARIESGRMEMNIGKCDLKRMIENVEDLLAPQMKEKNIRWEVRIDEKIPEMYLDSSQVDRVFINLVSNAIKFTPEKGKISIHTEFKDDVVTTSVSDTGIGISEENQKRLFDEFYRVDNQINQNVKGTGLGLALAKKIVEAHNGKIWITSKMNEGTTFHFTLPVQSPQK